MRSTGVVRKVDDLGRVVVPVEIRRIFDIQVSDPIEIYTEEDKIILKKYRPVQACMITGEISNHNQKYSGGIILSPEGRKLLVEELEKQAVINKKN